MGTFSPEQMSAYNKVVWSEGLFLQPQHFQQQDRHFATYVEARCRALIPYSWGFTEIELERDFLGIGKLGLRRASGVFPDGTPFRMPDDDQLPPAIDIGPNVRDQVVFLGIPLRRDGAMEVDRDSGADELARLDVRDWEVRDTSSNSANPALLEVGTLRTRLLWASAVTQAYACVPMAHVVECRADKQVVLEDRFMPTVLQAGASRRLAAFMTELQGLVHQRGEALAGRVVATSRGGAAEIAEYLLLQVVNRYEPLLAHLASSGSVHPEVFYRLCVSIAGELATFTAPTNRTTNFPKYRHDQLRESFEPVILELRRSLGWVQEQRAIPIPIEPKQFGISVAIVADRSLYTTAAFVLAARADVAAEDLRRRFPAQLRLGPVEKISNLVNYQLPGVPVHPMAAAPRQIPFHAGSVYFELDRSHELWSQLTSSGGIGLHVAGDFPGLAMELWAIRS